MPFIPPAIPGSVAFEEVAALLIGHGWSFGIFGGAARDILRQGAEARPRDFDLVVVDCPGVSDLKTALKPFGPDLNGFNGLAFKIDDTAFDVWRLEDTWAFQRLGIDKPVLTDLLKTTFFNIEQIVCELPAGHIHKDQEFTRAFQEHVLEVNYPDNPYPLLALIRTVVFVKKFGMRLGPKLEDWILGKRLEVKEGLVGRIQQKYFGRRVVSPEELSRVLDAACEAARARQRATLA